MSRKLPFLFIGLLALSLLASNLLKLLYGCFNSMDLGLYAQAILGLGEELNPFVSIRGLKIFNDHFEPVLYGAMLWTKVLGQNVWGLVVFEWLTWLIALFLVFRQTKNSWCLFVFLFCKGIMSAMVFPIHPVTWSLPALFFLVKFIKEERWAGCFFLLHVLCLFRESYIFLFVGLAIAVFLKNKKISLLSLASFALWYIGVFKFRDHLLGPTFDYGQWILTDFMASPFGFLGQRFSEFNFMALFKLIYPLAIPFYFLRNKKQELGVLLLTFSPLYLLHFITNKVHYQYGVFLIGPLVFFLFHYHEELSKKAKVITLSLFFLSGMGQWSKIFRVWYSPKKCQVSQEKKEAIQEMGKILKKEYTDGKILSTAAAPVLFMEKGREFWIPKSFSQLPPQFDYLLLESKGTANIDPLGQNDVENIKQGCESFHKQVFVDNRFFFFAKGDYPKDCLSL